jgi:hypothetical protein
MAVAFRCKACGYLGIYLKDQPDRQFFWRAPRYLVLFCQNSGTRTRKWHPPAGTRYHVAGTHQRVPGTRLRFHLAILSLNRLITCGQVVGAINHDMNNNKTRSKSMERSDMNVKWRKEIKSKKKPNSNNLMNVLTCLPCFFLSGSAPYVLSSVFICLIFIFLLLK